MRTCSLTFRHSIGNRPVVIATTNVRYFSLHFICWHQRFFAERKNACKRNACDWQTSTTTTAKAPPSKSIRSQIKVKGKTSRQCWKCNSNRNDNRKEVPENTTIRFFSLWTVGRWLCAAAVTSESSAPNTVYENWILCKSHGACHMCLLCSFFSHHFCYSRDTFSTSALLRLKLPSFEMIFLCMLQRVCLYCMRIVRI